MELVIREVDERTQEEARQLILDGLEEHFGFLDTSLNPDLDAIVDAYTSQGHVFLVGLADGRVVCSGALTEHEPGTGRLVRMSVRREYRRHGFASRIIRELETIAAGRGYGSVMLKTLGHWSDAVGFYESKGYRIAAAEGRSVTMVKKLST